MSAQKSPLPGCTDCGGKDSHKPRDTIVSEGISLITRTAALMGSSRVVDGGAALAAVEPCVHLVVRYIVSHERSWQHRLSCTWESWSRGDSCFLAARKLTHQHTITSRTTQILLRPGPHLGPSKARRDDQTAEMLAKPSEHRRPMKDSDRPLHHQQPCGTHRAARAHVLGLHACERKLHFVAPFIGGMGFAV